MTPLGPTKLEPQRGAPITQTVQKLGDLADVRMFYTTAEFSRVRLFQPRKHLYDPLDRSSAYPAVPRTYVAYPAFPYVSRPFNPFMCARLLYPHVATLSPDVLIAYWVYPEGLAALRVGRSLGIPVILGARGSDLLVVSGPTSSWLIRSNLRRANFVITVSENLRAKAIELGAANDRVLTIRNGCDTSVFRRGDRSVMRAQLGIDDGAKLALFVGRLHQVKGPMELIQAIASLAPSHPNLQLAVIGRGPLEDSFRSTIKDLGLPKRVHLLGSLPPDEVAKWMVASDLLCLPSHSEGYPNVAVESLCCGRPVVASRVGGVPEILTPECGLMVAPGDVGGLSAAIAEALERTWDEELIASQFGRSWGDVARETYEVCRVAVGESSDS